MKAVVATFNQERALVGAFSVLTNLRMELFQALISTVRAEYLLVSGLAGLSGGYVCFNIGVYAYTADVSR